MMQPDSTPGIQIEDVWRVYKSGERQVQALRGINLGIQPGRLIALEGRSGSGKTTLLNCLGGLDRPTSGRVRVFGRELASLNDEQLAGWRRQGVGFVFQSFGLLPTLSAYENVELMLRITGASRKARRERALECLALVGLEKWTGHRPYEMSGGQQQRVAIARALANGAPLILADEPTGELDTSTAREIFALFRRLVDQARVTLLIASHDALVREYADEVLRLEDGRINLTAAGK